MAARTRPARNPNPWRWHTAFLLAMTAAVVVGILTGNIHR